MVFSKATCENLTDAQINTQRREVAIQSLQCYNYSSLFFLLDKHKGGSLLASLFSLSSPPPLTARLSKQALIAPRSRGNTTSAPHPALIVSVGVGGLEMKKVFSVYRRGFVVSLGS